MPITVHGGSVFRRSPCSYNHTDMKMRNVIVLRFIILCTHTAFALFAFMTAAGILHAGCSRNNVHMAEEFTSLLHPENGLKLYPENGLKLYPVTPTKMTETGYGPLSASDISQKAYTMRSMYALVPSSTVLGSTINVAYIILLFEWVSVSFAWLYTFPYQRDTWTNEVNGPVLIIWNVALVIITAVNRSSWDIPTNNFILGTVTLIAATIVHVALLMQHNLPAWFEWVSLHTEDTLTPGHADQELMADMVDAMPDPNPAHNSDSHQHNSAPSAPPWTEENEHTDLDGNFNNHSRHRSNSQASRINAGMRSPRLLCNAAVFLRGPQSMSNTDVKHTTVDPKNIKDTTTLRYIEYAITAPLLMLATQSTIVMNGPIWALQVCYFSMLLCNVLGQAMHRSILGCVHNATPHAKGAAVLFLLSSWLFFSAAWVQFSHALLQMSTNLPTVAITIVSLMIPLYTLFGVAGTAAFFYLYQGAHDSQMILDWLNNVFDVLSIAVKVSVAAIILTSDELGPSSFCTTVAS